MSDPAPGCRRIVVIGMSGAGKSTLAHALARRLDAPHVELDALFWGPDWTPHPPAVFRESVRAAVAQPAWVIDGNYSLVRELIWPHACAVVWLDLPFWTVFRRVLVRTLRRGLGREILWGGNRESLARTFFSRESILWWVIRMHGRRRRDLAQLRASGRYPNVRWLAYTRSPTIDQVTADLGSPAAGEPALRATPSSR